MQYGREWRSIQAIVLFSSLLVACDDPPRYPALAPGATVLAFGDSITHGTGARKGEDYATRLAQRSGWEIVNAGIPGDTAGAAKARIEALLRETVPALVIVELGGNDFLQRRPEHEIKEDLRIIVQRVRASAAMPVLIGVPEVSIVRASLGSLSDAPIYAELAEEEDVLLVADILAGVLSDASLRADRIHPNAEGYRILADGIADALAAVGLLRAE